MKKFTLLLAFLLSAPVLAEYSGELADALDASVAEVPVVAVVIDAGVVVHPVVETTTVTLKDEGNATAYVSQTTTVTQLDSPLTAVQNFYLAVRAGDGWLAAMFILVALVGGLRTFGRKVHDWIPDDSPWDRPFYFIFQTKIGGWLMNWLTAIAGCLLTTHAAGATVDATAWKIAFMASTGATAIIELADDLKEWWVKKKSDQILAAATAAKPKTDA